MPKRIPPLEAAALIADGWIYLDVRSVPEFEQGHPEGAFNVPLRHMGPGGMSPNADFQRVIEARFPKDARIVIGCKSGGRSLQAASILESAGYTNVVDMRGGFHGETDPFGRVGTPGWLAAGLPVATAAPGCTWSELSSKK